jgi:stage V sporulation protein B
VTSSDADSAETPSGGAERAQTAKQVGRGGLAIAGAKLFFMVAGLVQQIALKHILGLQAYGALGRVQGLASVVYNPVIATSVQGVSRAVSGAQPAHAAAAQRHALSIHAVLAAPFALGLFVASPAIAALIRAPHLTAALHVTAAIMLFYGLYTPFVGAINGKRRFGSQALLDVLAATLRTFGLLGGAWYLMKSGAGVEGALWGFSISAALMALIAAPIAGLGARGASGMTTRAHLLFIAPLFGGQFALNLLFQSDLQLLGRFAADAALESGLTLEDADTLAGAYRNAQLFCFLPYQLLLSVTFVLFPLLAAAHRDGDRAAMARYTRTGVRLAMILAGAMVSVTAGLPRPLLTLVFGRDSAELGATSMGIMALGLGAFAIFGILTTVLTSLKHERVSAILTTAALGLIVLLCFLFVRGQPYGEGLLVRTALATGVGLLAATALAAHQVKQVAGGLVAPLTVVRVVLALGAAVAVARFLPPPGKLMTLAYALAIAAVYLVVLLASRELGKEDLAMIRRVVGR